MQQYQLTLPMFLRDWYLDPIIQGGLFIWGIIMLRVIIKYKKHRDKASVADEATYYGSIVGFVGALIAFWVILPLCFGLWQMGQGYKIRDSTLYLKTTEAQATIIIPEASIKLVKKDTEWQVKKRSGFGTCHLLTGWCELKSGKKALVFAHRPSLYRVIIQEKENYYVLAHPGVEELYQELIKRGAREGRL